MPQSNQTAEFNTFVGGLVTEASPLTFPENASIDEANFELNRNGSRTRRLGMNYEEGLVPLPITYTVPPITSPTVTTFQWENVAGIPNKAFIVCQVHNTVYIIDRADESLHATSGVKHTFELCSTCQLPTNASFASVDGKLVVAYDNPDIRVVSYSEMEDLDGSASSLIFPVELVRLKTRDLFGVEDKFNLNGTEVDLLSPEYINFRPVTPDPEDKHIYNLRNQGWAVPRARWKEDSDRKYDPIWYFENAPVILGTLPSNAETPVTSLFQKGADSSERFNRDAQVRLEPSKARAATGHFVIDLLDRGASREAEIVRTTDPVDGLYATSSLVFRTPTVNLLADRTVGGARVVAEFAGRVFYAGFSSENTEGDSQSPNLASYVFYSQLVKDGSQINRCYQEGDPTGPENPDLLETDGGFVRVAGAYNVQRMVNVGSSLLVFAENGVWAIGGSDSGTFSATNQSVNKISEHGTISPQSVVLVDGTVMYWADDAIYHTMMDNVGSWGVKELSVNIRTYYQDISPEEKALSQGIFDSYQRKVRWVYEAGDSAEPTKELIFDVQLAAFYPSIIGSMGASGPSPMSPVQVSPYNVSNVDVEVLAGTEEVLVGAEEVVVSTRLSTGGYSETVYLTLVNSNDISNTSLTFSSYRDSTFVDWAAVDGVGEDSPAYMLTGYMGNGDVHRQKQVPYVYFHFNRTENGFVDTGDDLLPLRESSCLVRSQWDWTNSPAYGKWGREFQAYRYRRHYTPLDDSDTFDYGTATIVSRNKLRGRGRVISFLISSEPAKDLQLLGWSMTIGMNGNG